MRALLYSLIVILGYGGSLYGQAFLTSADSLFEAGHYTEAYAFYARIREEGIRSPYAILRMAYIQEGLQSSALASYHLLDYHACTYDLLSFEQARRLAQRHGVGEGYVLSGEEQAILWVLRHRVWFRWVLGVILGIFAVSCWGRNRQKEKVFSLFGLLLFFVLFMGVSLMPRWTPVWGVVLSRTALMKGQSPAAGVEEDPIPLGTRIRVEQEGEVWLRVHYGKNGQRRGYVRKNKVGIVRYF